MSDKPLDGTVALVTGAGSTVGAATAHRLAREGAAVALVAPEGDRLDRLVDEIAARDGHAVAVPADITDPVHAERVVEATLDRFGRLDTLVNNAELRLLGTALHAMAGEWDRMVSLNVSALLHVTYAAVPHLIDAASTSPREVADLVNVSSTAGRVARPGGSVYHLTRFGLSGFSESLRQELLAEQVRVSLIEPGTVDTEWLSLPDEATRAAAVRPAGGAEPLRAGDIADAISYVVCRERRVAVSEIVLRAAGQIW